MNRITRSALLLLMLATGTSALAGTASAGALQDAAAQAEAKAAAGDTVGAFTIMRDAMGVFAEKLPLTIGKASFVRDVPTAYGIYNPKPEAVFRSGEALITYVEPIGLKWRKTADGKVQSNFTVDFELRDSKGEVLAAQKAFGNFSFIGEVRNQEIFTHLTLDITGAQPGNYTLRYILNDTIGAKAITLDQPFQLVP